MLIHFWLGGAVCTALHAMAERSRLTAFTRVSVPLQAVGILLSALLWPLMLLVPVFQAYALRRGFHGLTRVHCVVCDAEGVAFIDQEHDILSFPDGWWLSKGRMVCSRACALHLRECPNHDVG